MAAKEFQQPEAASRPKASKAPSKAEGPEFAELFQDVRRKFEKNLPSNKSKSHCCKMFKKLLEKSMSSSQSLSILQHCDKLNKSAKKNIKKIISKKLMPLPSSPEVSIPAVAEEHKIASQKTDASTQDSFIVPPIYPEEYYSNLPTSITLRIAPCHIKAHKAVLLAGQIPRVEVKCALAASLKEVFRRLKSYFCNVCGNELAGVGKEEVLHLAVDAKQDGNCFAWTESLSDSVLLRELFLLSGKKDPLYIYYYWAVSKMETPQPEEDVYKTEEYEGLIQFLATIVSGVLEQMKKKRRKRPKPENSTSENENVQKTVKEQLQVEETKKETQLEEDIDMAQPFKRIFEKPKYSAKHKDESQLFCPEFLSSNQELEKADIFEESRRMNSESSVSFTYMPPNALNSAGHQPGLLNMGSNHGHINDMGSLQLMFSQHRQFDLGSSMLASNQPFTFNGGNNPSEGLLSAGFSISRDNVDSKERMKDGKEMKK